MEPGDFRGQRPLARLDDLLRLLVVEAIVGVDDGAAEPLPDDLGLVVHLEDGAEGEFVFLRPEGAQIVGQFLGQHRDGAVHQIDRGAAGEGFLVDRGARRHVVRHVGDVDADLQMAVFEFAEREGVVEVLGVGRVDGESGHAAEVAAAGQVFGRDGVGYLLGRLLHLGFEAVGQLEFGQDGVHLGVVLARNAQHVNDAPDRLDAPLRPVRDQHGHLHAVGGFQTADFRQLVGAVHVDPDVIRHILALDNGPHLPAADHEDADMRLRTAVDDLDHLAFQAAAFHPRLHAALRDGNLHEVAVQGEMEFAHRHEHIVLQAFDFYETEAVAREGNGPFELFQRLAAALRRPDGLLQAAGNPLGALEGAFS